MQATLPSHLFPSTTNFYRQKFNNNSKKLKKISMALNASIVTNSTAKTKPSALLSPSNAGLRQPSDRFALKSAFFAPSIHLLLSPSQIASVKTTPKFSMRVASKQSYICRDCGYIYSDKTPFEKLPDNYYCPVCGAPKRRFRAYEPKVAKNANDTDLRKVRKEQLKRDEAIGKALPIAIVVGVVALVGLYFYLNNAF